MLRMGKSTQSENRLLFLWGYMGRRGDDWGVTMNENMVSFWDDENILELVVML